MHAGSLPARLAVPDRPGRNARCFIDPYGGPIPVTRAEQQLLALWNRLGAADRAALLAFAEFLEQRDTLHGDRASATTPREIPAPEVIERPPQETVVAALKRLARTYPMLDKSVMLGATSELVARHIMQGTDSAAAIDELEVIFSEHYRQFRDAQEA